MTITLPYPNSANLLVKAGDVIQYGKALYSQHEAEHHIISISQQLKVKPAEIFSYLVTLIESSVKKGQAIAEKKKILGKKRIKSPVDGTLIGVDHTSGTVTIESMAEATHPFSAYCNGTVESIDETSRTITIALAGGIEIKTKSVSDSAGGMLFSQTMNEAAYNQNQETIAEALIIQKHLDSVTIAKCEALGANGFIFLTADTIPSSPYTQLPSDQEFEKIITNPTAKYGIFSECDKKCIVY